VHRALILLLVPAPAFAADILYCNDHNVGTDQLAAALDASGHAVTMTADIDVECEAEIATGAYDLVVLAVQNNDHETPNFIDWADGGGAAMLQDYTGNTSRFSAFGLTTAAYNETALEVTDASLASGLSTKKLTVTNSGWGTYAMTVTTSTASTLAKFPSGSGVTLADGRLLYNGFLTDTLDATNGPVLYANELDILLGGSRDADEDGYAGREDCDDSDPDVHPGASEDCNEADDDCDGDVDEGVTETYWLDDDGDGFGDGDEAIDACSRPVGYVANDGDCDDGDDAVSPDGTELCNGEDDDCDGDVDDDPEDGTTFYEDDDGDGFGDSESTTRGCDEVDGYVSEDDDCDDGDEDVNPDADEDANGVDDDCDGKIDDEVDSDGDGLDDYSENEEHGTDPDNADSDGDGVDDGTEIDDGTDPLDPADPATPDGDEDGGAKLCGCASTGGAVPWAAIAGILLVFRRRR
jgi:hypothetical protein